MVAVTVKRVLRMTDREQRALRNMEQPQMVTFMERMSESMLGQARRNIRAFGTLRNLTWPQLSTAYLKRKKAGKTPGRGSNKAGAMLRDTGMLYASLVGIVTAGARGSVRLALDAEGSRKSGKRILTNADLLRYHHRGAGRLPRRSPVQDMTLFQKRFATALRAHLSGR
jgi:hypothetical protein